MRRMKTLKDGLEMREQSASWSQASRVESATRSMPVQMASPAGSLSERVLSRFLPTGFQNLLQSPAARFIVCLTHKGFVSRTLWVKSCRHEAESALDAACWVLEVGAQLSGEEKASIGCDWDQHPDPAIHPLALSSGRH